MCDMFDLSENINRDKFTLENVNTDKSLKAKNILFGKEKNQIKWFINMLVYGLSND